VLVQNSAPTPGKVVGGHDLLCGGSGFSVDFKKSCLQATCINQLSYSSPSTATLPLQFNL
jgi:hypothetical protein